MSSEQCNVCTVGWDKKTIFLLWNLYRLFLVAKWSKRCLKCPKWHILPYFHPFLVIMLNTGAILIFTLQDTISGIKTKLLISILLGFMTKKYLFYKGFPLWIFGAKINVAKTASRYFIEGKRFLCPSLLYRNISCSGFNIAGCILQSAFLDVTKIWPFYGKNRVPTWSLKLSPPES